MTTNESLNFFLRLIKEKHNNLISLSNELLRTLSGEDLSAKKSIAKNTLSSASDLRALISNNDVPPWLNDLLNYLNNFVNGNWTSFDLLSNFINTKTLLENHEWVFNGESGTAFDFDSIFEHFKNESKLPELFDQIISLLTDINDSGEIDSVTMLNALGKVVATIKKCKDGSYFSLNSAWEFLLAFLKNYMWEELSKLPVLGSAMEALEKTIKETNEEMFKLHMQVQDEMKSTVEREIKVLANKSTFNFITYDKEGHLLSGPGQFCSTKVIA